MKLKQHFNKLTEDMFPMLLFAIKECAPEIYKECKNEWGLGDKILVFEVWNLSIDAITYTKIIDFCNKYSKMKAFT